MGIDFRVMDDALATANFFVKVGVWMYLAVPVTQDQEV